jgi:hypothetical protein
MGSDKINGTNCLFLVGEIWYWTGWHTLYALAKMVWAVISTRNRRSQFKEVESLLQKFHHHYLRSLSLHKGIIHYLRTLTYIIWPFQCWASFTNTTFFLTCSNMGALVCNYLPDEASGVHEFSTMNRQDGHLQFDPKRSGHLQFDPKRSNLRSYTHGQLRLGQAKLAIA